ncbi:MAG: thiamine monophosphate synthase [Henriciella sp.]|jgi:thiamine monophosphate synthase|uniref:thiamine phosphate synthase n=1 Tax=Henriciella sp. TaxID=1968823 RepID=UPI000C0EA923|nr:thiamine phosphate synthase [Henriciella sp.]MAN75113.1 thiamine monophosphate synthase [Henriciella sp.]MBF33690.1 thiamine monophosphate synthase [Hyphomonadaceae bacterium]MBK76436.1 thiamine monophosphate synthase [Henriciella sp.]PHR77916.1 MAG: thiamine monophosphate synthase [Henriciella sp.]|tara:strand:+ start:683 stop:1285 length:603 start_codon:yes stop_codon:yes gene_type:complete
MKHAPARSRKFRNAARRASAHTGPHLPGGFFLTDPDRLYSARTIAAGLPEGIGVIIRHFGQAEAIGEARAIVADARRAGRIVLIAADPALAKETGADGVHWPFRLQRQMLKQRHEGGLHTMSVHSAHEVRAATRCRPHALIYSAVFPSSSPSAGAAKGLMRFAAIARQTQCPVYALGGITHINAERAAQFGGFASVSGFR